ncbi:hypothetical protein PG984_006963 [Apiospora sp. TS-2023a]
MSGRRSLRPFHAFGNAPTVHEESVHRLIMEMGNRRSPRRAELDELAFTRRVKDTHMTEPGSQSKAEDAIMHEGHPDSTATQRETSSDTKMEDEQHAISDDATSSEPAPPATDVKEEQSGLEAVITAVAENGETMGPPTKERQVPPFPPSSCPLFLKELPPNLPAQLHHRCYPPTTNGVHDANSRKDHEMLLVFMNYKFNHKLDPLDERQFFSRDREIEAEL